jgi:universal stress protein A
MKIKPNRKSGEVLLEVSRRDDPLLAAAATTPFRLKKILVPVDFSDCSKKALQYALPLAKQHDAAITLIYVAPNPAYAADAYGLLDYASILDGTLANGEKNLASLLADEVGGKVPGNAVVRAGSPGVQIADLAKSMLADLIIISTHGHTGLKHVLLGSVAEHVVRHAPCPVLVVREREHEFVSS